MAKRSVIRKTAVCWWDSDDGVYLVRSPLFPVAIAQGETKAAVWSAYEEVLDDALESLSKGKLGGYSANGRPAKGGINIHCQVQPFSKETLNAFAEDLGISQGEVIDWALFTAKYKSSEKSESNPVDAKTIDVFTQMVKESSVSNGEPYAIPIPIADAPLQASHFVMTTEAFRNAFIRQILAMNDSEIHDMVNSIEKQSLCQKQANKLDNSPEK